MEIIHRNFCDIHKIIPNLEYYTNDIILYDGTNYNDGVFNYPFKINGLLLGVLLEGSLDMSINLSRVNIKPKQIFTWYPGDIIQIFKNDKPVAMNTIVFKSNYIYDLNLKINIKDFITNTINRFNKQDNTNEQLSNNEIEELCTLYNLIKNNLNTQYLNKEELLKNLSSSFIYTFSKYSQKQYNNIPDKSTSNRDMSIFIKFIELLSQHHYSQRSVNFYANEVCLSPKYFSYYIKKISGNKASYWIDKYVILEAKSLLKNSDKSIQEIAFGLNFPNQSFFGKYFKRHTGMSPGTYRAL